MPIGVYLVGGSGLRRLRAGARSDLVVGHQSANGVGSVIRSHSQAVQGSCIGTGSGVGVQERLAVVVVGPDTVLLHELGEAVAQRLQLIISPFGRAEHEHAIAVGSIGRRELIGGTSTVVVNDYRGKCIIMLRHNLSSRRHSDNSSFFMGFKPIRVLRA